MRNNFKQMSKRTLAMFMSLLMIMSCWVFVAPLRVEAADYSLTELYNTYLNTSVTTVSGSFTHDSTTNPSQYVNVLYSPAYTQGDIYAGVASGSHQYDSSWTGSVSADIDWHHSVTTMMYDGVTPPQTGVMMTVDPNKSGTWAGEVRTERAWLSNGDLQFPSYWKGICGENLDFAWCMNQADQLNYLSYNTDSSKIITRKASQDVPVFGNVMRYTGSMNDSTYFVEIKPVFNHYGVGSDNGYTITATSSNSIYVINYKPLKAAIENARTVIAEAINNGNIYTSASIAEVTRLANALVAAKPNNFINASTNNVSGYAAAAKAAVDAWNASSKLVKKPLVTWKNWDGTILATNYVEPGSTPSFSGATPVKPADDKYIYTFANWSPAVGAVNSDTTYTAQYSKTGNDGKVLFDNLIDFSEWDRTNANNAAIIPLGDTGFVLTSNDGVGEGTTSSPYFPVTPGKSYYVDIDIMGSNWDVYFFFCDANGSYVDFNDSKNRFSSNGSGVASRTFTAPAGSVKGQIRVDANGSVVVTQVNSIRVFDASLGDKTLSVHPSQTVKYEAAYNTYASLPTPTRTAYSFAGWVLADGTAVNNNTIVKDAPVHTLFSKWTPVTYTMTVNANGGNAVASKQFNVESGTMPATPTRTAYDFVNWEVVSGDGNWTVGDTYNADADISGKYGNVTIKANWTPIVYTITLDENGGVDVADSTYTVEAGTVPAAPVRTGYTFSHWEVVSNNGTWTAGTKVNPGDNLAGKHGNVSLKAVWNSNGYTLNFNINKPAGAVTEPECEKSSIDVTFDAAIGTLPVPTLDGYTFAGWYDAATGGTQVTAATVYTTADDSTVYATWTPVTYNINTDANGGNDVADGTYTIENGTIPAGGTRTGYTFSHWEVAADSGNWVAGETFDAGSSAAGKYSDVTLKAIWTANDYTASFELNDAEGIGSASVDKNQITVTYDSAVNTNEALPVATRNGYTFLGWFTSAEGGEKITEATVYTTDGNATYYAQWALVEYTLTLNVNNGNPIDPITYTIEDSLTLPTASRNGYEFTNWFYSGVTTGSWVRNTSYTPDALALGTGNWGNVEIKANYTVKSFNITWIVNGESEVTTHPFNTYPTHEDPVIENDSCYIYEFTGWDPVVEVVSGDATYTAVFKTTPREYTVSWVADGVTVHSQKVAYGADVPTGVADVPAKTGHTGEWDYTGVTTMPAEDITIEAVYTPVNYTISWEVEGTVVDTDSVAYGTLPSYTGSTPVKTEDSKYTYEFAGWTPEISAVSGEATYTAVFNSIPKTYTIYWYAEDNSLVTTQDVAYGSAITNIPKVPEKLGSVGSWVDVPETMPDHDVMIYPAYVKGSLVTWFLEGTADGTSYQQGFENGTQITYNRSNPTKPADAEYTYTFEGWATAENGSVVIGTDNTGYPVASESDFSYYAVFSKTPREYTIEWVADGEVVYSEIIAYGSAVDFIPEVPAKTGHTGKWGTSPATMPAKDVTVTAEYTPIDYTITWIVDGNENETTFAYGTMPSFSGSTAKPSTATTDYTFTGWDKEIETVTGDTTYTAQYSEAARKYTVTWQYDNGTVIDTFTVANGAAITDIPAIADKEGHTYSYTVPEVMPAEDIVIVVTYEAKDYTITWVTPSGSTETTWKYGTTPVYDGETPVKEATAEKVYTFAGWNPEILVVTGNATYTAQFTEAARRYSVVWYVNGEFFDARDIAFGDTIPSLDVPQVPGYNGVWDNPFRTMPAHDVTINAVYNAKKYTVYWKVDGLTVYSASVAYGDSIPSKIVPEKVGCTGEWVNVPDKMPAENITISAVYTANDYTITWRVDGVEHSDTITYGNEYVLTLDGAAIPEEVRVTIGGSLMNAESYHYDAGTGTLTIYGHAITGNIYVTARAAGGNYNIILNVTNATLSNSSLVIAEKTAYHTQIIPAAGYLLPPSVDVFVDGMPVDGFTYNPANGKLTINAEVIVGELEIAFDCPPDPDYDPSATPDEGPDTGHCSCSCHSESAFTKFFFNLITFLRKLFGMDEYRYCECGAAHW